MQQDLLHQNPDLFDLAPFGYCIADRVGRIQLANQAVCKLLGKTGAELKDRLFQSFLYSPDQGKFETAISEVFSTGKKITVEFPLTGQGYEHLVRAELVVMPGEDIFKMGIFDISEQKVTQEALRKSEEKYRMFIELAADAFFQGDHNGSFITVNDKAIELTGYSREELLRMNIRELFSDEEQREKPLRYDKLIRGETVKTERELMPKSGRKILIEMNSKMMPDGTYQSFFRDITERTRAEKALIESERKYRNLHMSLIDGYVFTDMTGRIIDSNEVFRQMVGYTADELVHLSYPDFTPERWHSFEQSIVEEHILVHGASQVYLKEYRHKSGYVFPVELRTFLVKNESGINEGMWAIVRDVTEREKAEAELRKSEEKFRSIVESSPTAMYFYHLGEGEKLILTGANPAADEIIGISHESLIGKTITEAFPNLAETGIPEMYRKVARNEIGAQLFEIEYKDERFSGFYTVHVFRTGVDSIAVDFFDITKRKQTEEALRRSEIEYRDTLNSLPNWIYVVDEQFKIAMVNKAVKNELKRLGLLDQYLGEPINDCFPFISKQTLKITERVFKTGSLASAEQQFEFDGRLVHAEFTAVPILKDTRTVKVILVIRDRSKEKEIEELKRRNTEQKEMLLREIHHRVKNNLAIVISLLNFQLRNNENEGINRIIIDIQTRIRSMALIHEHLYRSENLDRIRLESYIESLSVMIMTTFSGNRIKLVTHLDPVDVNIESALPIGLIVNELLTNAFKYAFPGETGGTIEISLEKAANDMCNLTVEDDGVGLPSSFMLDSEKSLGLYIVGLLVEQLEGSVDILRDKGTSFRITFKNALSGKQQGL